MPKFDKDISAQFRLPKYTQGMSFADATKAVDNRFKDRYDSVSKQTKEELMGRLKDAQEFVRSSESPALTKNDETFRVGQNGSVYNPSTYFAEGGYLSSENMNKYNNGGTISVITNRLRKSIIPTRRVCSSSSS